MDRRLNLHGFALVLATFFFISCSREEVASNTNYFKEVESKATEIIFSQAKDLPMLPESQVVHMPYFVDGESVMGLGGDVIQLDAVIPFSGMLAKYNSDAHVTITVQGSSPESIIEAYRFACKIKEYVESDPKAKLVENKVWIIL